MNKRTILIVVGGVLFLIVSGFGFSKFKEHEREAKIAELNEMLLKATREDDKSGRCIVAEKLSALYDEAGELSMSVTYKQIQQNECQR